MSVGQGIFRQCDVRRRPGSLSGASSTSSITGAPRRRKVTQISVAGPRPRLLSSSSCRVALLSLIIELIRLLLALLLLMIQEHRCLQGLRLPLSLCTTIWSWFLEMR